MSLTAQATCSAYDWNPITTAGSWVPFTGGIAGFLFTGLVFLLSTKPRGSSDAASNAFKLLITAFFGFLTMAYLTAGLSGEHTCPRAYTGFAIIGGVLATSVICMCISLTWLLPAYKRYSQEILPFLRHIVYFIFTLASIMLGVSSFGYIQTSIGTHLPLQGTIMVIFSAVTITAGFIAAKRHKARGGDKRNSSVQSLARWALGYLATASVLTGVVMSIPKTFWDPPADAVIYLAAYASLVVPLYILFRSIGAIAAETTPSVPQPVGQKGPDGSTTVGPQPS